LLSPITTVLSTRLTIPPQYSKVRANAVREGYNTLKRGMKKFEDGLNDPLRINATIEKLAEMSRVDVKDLGVQWRDSYDNDFAYDVGAMLFTGWGEQVVEKGLDMIIGNVGNAIDFTGIASGLSIVNSIYSIVHCITGHKIIYGQKKAELDAAKKQHDSVKDAYGQLEHSLEDLDNQVNLMNEKIDLLTDYANKIYKILGSNCTSSSATVLSDLEEIDEFVIRLKDDFDLYVDINGSLNSINEVLMMDLQDEKEILEEDGETMTLAEEERFVKRRLSRRVRTEFKALQTKNSKMEPDIILDKMKVLGFEFSFKWSEWAIISDDESCDCKSRLSQCNVKKVRTCSSGKCLGPDQKTFNRCEKFQFFSQCKSKDKPLVGSCISPNNAKVDSGDLSGKYVSAGVKLDQCYRDCKSTPGALGCEYLKTSCSPTQGCTGECFAVTEGIESGDKMPDGICYKFKEASNGIAALPMLQQVFDATAQMMTGRNFNSLTFREMYLYFMKVDENIIHAQENAWQQMFKYQSKGLKDKWGGNPSDYQEREKRSLSFQNTKTSIFEPCNFASNWAYYHLAASTRKLQWLGQKRPETVKALVQSTTGLAFSSSFFHGSHTHLGQLLDNHMIKIIAYILYQTHIESSGFNDPLLTDLVPDGRRDMTGVQMAEYMTQVFKDLPATEWTQKVEKMDVPSYEKSFSALILTLLEQMEFTGPITSFVTSNIMSSMGVSQEEIRFLKEEFRSKLKDSVDEWNSKNDAFWKKPDPFNTFAALIRTLSAFPFQETYSIGQGPLKFFNWVIGAINGISTSKKLEPPLDKLNNNLDHFSTLAEIEPVQFVMRNVCPFERPYRPLTNVDLFPGIKQCKKTNKHSLWHAQSARGILDFLKHADEFIRKQTDHLNPTTAADYDEIEKKAIKIGCETYESVLNAGKNIAENDSNQAEGGI